MLLRPLLLTATLLTVFVAGAGAQVPSIVRDPTMVAPHRVELREISPRPNGQDLLDAWVYVTVDHAQSWGQRLLMINWTALTWNGTGFDVNLVGAPDYALLARVTPIGVPFAQIIESHYYSGRHRHLAANPDEDSVVTVVDGGGPDALYNEIVWPYLLAGMNLRPGQRFTLPAYSPYRSVPILYQRFHVQEPVTVTDAEGHEHKGWRVWAVNRASESEVNLLPDDAPGRHVIYLVSSEPPYFLGKEYHTPDTMGVRRVDKRWVMTRHTRLTVSPLDRIEEILRVRRTRAAGQVIPWRRP
jgi:hypothetical protein